MGDEVRIKSDYSNFSSEIKKQITESLGEYRKELNKAAEDTAKEIVEILKENSPKKTGKYAKAWTYEETSSVGTLAKTFTVYNKQKGNKTHLLEHGWVSKNQYGTYGRVDRKPHIQPAEEEGERIFFKKAEEIIND